MARRFAARPAGLASGLALAVRPVGAAEARVPLTTEGPPRTMRGVLAPAAL